MICTEIECRRSESVQNLGLFVCTLQSAHFEPSAHLGKCAEGVCVCRRSLHKERSLFTLISTDLHSLGLLHTKKCAEGSKCAEGFCVQRGVYVCRFCLICTHNLHTSKCAEGLKCAEDFIS
jgi:hypothetical protein